MKFNLQTTAKAAAIVTAAVIVVKAVKAIVAKVKANQAVAESGDDQEIASAKIFSGNEREDLPTDEGECDMASCDCEAVGCACETAG